MSVVSYIFDSNTTVAVSTAITASVAYLVYRKQKTDSKRDAANIILLEIKSAERRIRSAMKSIAREDKLLETTFLMKDESWTRYKYLFVNDFDRDDWDTISEFYENCQLYDEALRRNNESFSKNEDQIRGVAHRIMGDAAKDMVKAIQDDPSVQSVQLALFNAKAKVLGQTYFTASAEKPLYSAQKHVDDAKFFLGELRSNITQTSPGTTLKRLAKTTE